ncbi:bifunctional diguanylate cyclase/phosphodiesterase [Lacimicrobium alkaliphilum]|uniref:Phosphodiesterase n=1 Tax=Lacimicrobium alkaliphilum TaxID=1526571 RepID=A0ABQ1QZG6_9ALTE|nr:EAL domain-containing protein [Lacimicrobium alkaliphilum]GGD49684.1 phosphodiesterase [Lacimicrobium alkaliphilum]
MSPSPANVETMTHSLLSKLSSRSLRSRMLMVFLLLLALIVVVTLVTVQKATYQHSTGQVRDHAKTSAIVVKDKIRNRSNQLASALATLAKDFNTKQLIAGGRQDQESLLSALKNHQRRIDADLSWVLDENHQLLTVTTNISTPMPEIDFPKKTGITWQDIAGRYYLLEAVPVRFVESSPKVNAWLIAAVDVQRLITQELITLTDMQVSIFSPAPEGKLIASTFASPVANVLQKGPLTWTEELQQIWLPAEGQSREYIYASADIGNSPDGPLKLLFATIADKAYLSYNSLIGQLILILVIAALLALTAAVIISNGITRPLTRLVNVTNKIRKGQYVEEVPKSTTLEISSLSTAIDEMQQGIKQRELEIQQMAYFDALTGLPNRNQFNNQLQQALTQHRPVVVLMMDVDRFKDINDTLGHGIGDQLLVKIASRLSDIEVDNLFVARLGGDEFGLIWFGDNSSTPKRLASQVVDVFKTPFDIEQLRLDLDLSIGVAIYPDHGDNPSTLIQCADIAMYSCKGHHRAFAIYRPELNKYSLQRLSLMSELRSALAEGQLKLYYQPKLMLADGQVSGAECLIRWIHPVHGFIPPDQFIPLAEQTGAIRDVTRWALKEAMHQQQKWSQAGLSLNMAVNISPLDLVDMQLPDIVADLFSQYNGNQGGLTLEVTESAVMSDPDMAIRALEKLKSMGVILSIDDFGTGYSSMAQLKKMPVHELKIDKAFVLDLATNSEDQIMVNTLLGLARHLGLKTVAEGVEDASSLAFLKRAGCHKAQGFYMSKPLPAADFDMWLKNYPESSS